MIWAVVDLEFSPPPAPPLVRGGEKEHSSPRLGGGREGADYLLELSHPVLDYVDVVELDFETKKILNRWETGDLRPFDSRPINHRSFLFRLSTNGNFRRIYFRISSESSTSLPIKIWRPEYFALMDSKELLFIGAYYGLLFMMVVYNLIISIATKTLSGYFYVIYVFLLAIIQSTLDGLFINSFQDFAT